MFKRLLATVLTLCVIFAMCGCGSVKDLIEGDQDEELYETSKNVNLAMAEIKTINPVLSQDEDSYYINRLIYQSLFRLDQNLVPQNDLVTSYDISKTGKSVVLKLDSAARFSDGEKVTSGDVRFSIEAYQAAGKKCKYNYEVKDIKRVETDGSSKIKIVFESEGGSLAKLTFPILPSHIYDVSDITDSSSSFRPVGSGPYKVSSYEKNDHLTLKPNKEYAGEIPENVLKFTTYKKKAEVINLLEGNIVSYTTSDAIDRQKEISSNNLRSGEYNSNRLVFVGFNCNKKSLKSEKNRQAICYAIDTAEILQKAFYGSGVLSDSIFYPGYMGMENKGDALKLDKKKSKDILEKEGWKDKNKDGYLEYKGKKVKLRILVGESNPRSKAAKFIVSNLEDIGIECEVKKCRDKDFRKALKNGKFDLYVGEISFGAAYDLTDFIGGSLDYTGYEYSKLENRVSKTAIINEQEDLFKNAESIRDIMNVAVPVYPLLYKTYSYIVSDELQGEVSPVFNDIYRDCSKWSSKYEIQQTEEDKEKKKK